MLDEEGSLVVFHGQPGVCQYLAMTILREFFNIFISDVVTSNCFFCVVNPVLSSTCLKLYWACAITGGPSHFGAPHGTGVFEAAPDLISYNSAISACEAAGEWENTLALLEAVKMGAPWPSHWFHLFLYIYVWFIIETIMGYG